MVTVYLTEAIGVGVIPRSCTAYEKSPKSNVCGAFLFFFVPVTHLVILALIISLREKHEGKGEKKLY